MTEKQYQLIERQAAVFIDTDKMHGKELTREAIDGYINRASEICGLSCDDKLRSRLFEAIERNYLVKHTPGVGIFDSYQRPKWYRESDTPSDFSFWTRYRMYLTEKSAIDSKSIDKLDHETLPNILNCLNNPREKQPEKRFTRGLVIGDVQSGKTATYTGLICKAADAGYRVVILLAGITETLRQQTQERIDEGIVGLTERNMGNTRSVRVGVGKDNGPIRAISFTSNFSDFRVGASRYIVQLSQTRSLVLFVVKKNVRVLNRLYQWLHDQNANPLTGCIDQPMLLIDDEADNATVNTHKPDLDPTATNRIIRKICTLFSNANYVGFTATPFANIFINPDYQSVDDMLGADLFPEHFIYVLPTPSNYIGAQRLFYDGEEEGTERGDCYDRLHFITDIEEPDYASEEYRSAPDEELNRRPFYYKHKKEWDGQLPASLRQAVLCFFLANAVRDERGQRSKPRSMLINMSRFTRVHQLISQHVGEILDKYINTVRYDFSEDSEANKRLPLFEELHMLWHKYFSQVKDVSEERVLSKKALLDAVQDMEVRVVNAQSDDRLDYKAAPSLRVIAVGGLALSRGLTLEGLLVSYCYRNTATFDVLMQMGRWFGYRTGYEDLFQVWTSRTTAEWYRDIDLATQELKDNVRQMFEQRLTPKAFGICVRDYDNQLGITAPNKMRQSYDQLKAESYYGDIYDTPYISANVAHNRNNRQAVSKMVRGLLAKGYQLERANVARQAGKDGARASSSRYFADVPKACVVDLLTRLQCSLRNPWFNTGQLSEFICDSHTTGVERWDVVFEGGNSEKLYDIEGLEQIHCMKRSIEENGHAIQISSRRRVISLREGLFALTADQVSQAESACRQAWEREGRGTQGSIPIKAYFQYLPQRKPLLIVMLIEPNSPEPGKDEPARLTRFRQDLGDSPIVAFAVGFPGVKAAPEVKRYKINKVYYDQLMHEADETYDEEDE